MKSSSVSTNTSGSSGVSAISQLMGFTFQLTGCELHIEIYSFVEMLDAGYTTHEFVNLSEKILQINQKTDFRAHFRIRTFCESHCTSDLNIKPIHPPTIHKIAAYVVCHMTLKILIISCKKAIEHFQMFHKKLLATDYTVDNFDFFGTFQTKAMKRITWSNKVVYQNLGCNNNFFLSLS